MPLGQECAVEEAQHPRSQRVDLARKAEDQGAAAHVRLVMQALGHARRDALGEDVELVGQVLGRDRCVHRQGRAQHRAAAFDVQVVVEFGEAGQQVGLGEHHIDGRGDLQRALQLGYAAADGGGVGVERVAVGPHQLVQPDRDQHPVDRLQRAMLAQQGEEALPGAGIGDRVGVLGRIAPRRVDDGGFVGEPEVEIARAADPLQRRVGEGKAQAGIEQGGGLAGAGRSDDHVPGAAVEIVALVAGGLLQRAHGGGHPRGEVLGLGVAGLRLGQLLGDGVRSLACAQHSQQREDAPHQGHQQHQQQPHPPGAHEVHEDRQRQGEDQRDDQRRDDRQRPPVEQEPLHEWPIGNGG